MAGIGTYLAEDDVGVRGRGLEDVRLGDDEEDLRRAESVGELESSGGQTTLETRWRSGAYVLRLLDGAADDARDRLHAQLLHGLAGLLLAAGLLAALAVLIIASGVSVLEV